MSGTGTVIAIDGGTVPNTNEHATRLLVARPDATWLVFFIPADGPQPDLGASIGWGPHHAWWGEDAHGGGPAVKVAKLTWEMDPDAPLS